MFYWVALAAFLSGLYMRRRISRKWIDLRGSKANDGDGDCKVEDLAGKTVIITGGNVGLGYEAALDLARRGCSRIVLGCRNVEKGQEAADRILQECKSNEDLQVECLLLDMASLASVRKFAESVKSKYTDNIHALILNAGVWVPMEKDESIRKTEDGFEIHFGVNHLAHFLLVRCLLDHLKNQSNNSRIVFVSSSLLKSGRIDFESQDFMHDGRVEREDPTDDNKKKIRSFAPTGYCDSKLMNALTCRYLATLLHSNKISTYALCPGFCRSSLGRNVDMAWIQKILIAPIFLLIQRTSAQGAQNIVFCTVTKAAQLQNGALYRDGEIMEEETEYIDGLGSEAPKKLWDLSEEILNAK